ncbi:MAG: amino acid permease [Candidatus Krumholzibacteriota bacterium]|nr:amino acid permease [Candidatus Krumholzibacteriota bacterium]
MKLKKELKLLDIFCLASGAMISSGLFILPGLAHARAGPAVVISYFLAGLLAMTGMFSQAELVSAMPKSGGTYFYVKRSLGPAVGTVDGLITWFSLSLKSAFALVGMAAFSAYLISIDIRIMAIALCSIFIVINLFGIKEASRIQVGLVFCLMGLLLYFIIRGFPEINVRYLEPFAPRGVTAIFSTAAFVFVSFGGLLKVASVAEEVKNPGKVIPRGMILSIVVVSIFYSLVVFITSGVLDPGLLEKSLTPISDAAAVFMGNRGRVILSLAALMAFISTANAGIIAASRFPLALSRDGLLPGFLGSIGRRYKTPYVSILITGFFMMAVMFLELDVLIKAASAVLILTYIFSCLSIIILRESRLQNYQPVFRSPLYPWIQIAGIIGFGFLLFELGLEAITACAGLIVCGLLVYWVYGRIRAGREFALLHLIERITAKELTSRTLETELKEIIRERDDIVKDRFDRVVERAVVLDIDKPITMKELFNLVSEAMAGRLGLETEDFMKLLMERERESSTVLNPYLAIPHIIIDREDVFEVLLARCKSGVEFSETANAVKSIFVLAGSKNERNFHLRALAGIAQIVRDPHFEENWMKAKDKEGLRDIILLGKRKR